MMIGSVTSSVMIDKLAYIGTVIALPMIVGYIVRRAVVLGDPGRERGCAAVSRTLKLMCIAVLAPPIAVSAILTRPLGGSTVMVMPMIGVAYLIAAALLGRWYIAATRMEGRRGGAFLSCSSMTNMLSFGGLICYAFWQDDGLQQVYLMKLLEHLLYYGWFYPWCSTFSPDLGPRRGGLLGALRLHPVTLMPLGAVVVGVVWNWIYYAGPMPPEGPYAWMLSMNKVLVPCQVGLLTFAVGLTMAPSRIRAYWRECLAVSAIKFVALPVLTAGVAYACMRLGWISPLGFKVAVVISSMPVAFNSLIPPSLFHLDEDLANSCWLFTSAMLVVTVPVLYLLLT